MGKSGSRRWKEPTSRNNWLSAGKTSARSGLRMELAWVSFPHEPITHSSVSTMSPRRPCSSWPRLWTLMAIPRGRPTESGPRKRLTPGNCEVDQWSFTPDRKPVLFNSNCRDVDRRHLWRVNASGGEVGRLTTGEGLEWSPMPLGDGQKFAYLGSDA